MDVSRRRLSSAALIGGALALPNVTSVVGAALAPQLLAHAPLVLLMLHPYAPFALLVLPEVPLAVFVVVAVAFRLGPRYLAFLAGRTSGEAELQRYLSRHPRGRVARMLPTSRRLISPALVVVAGAPVSAMAGALGVGTRRFLLWCTLGATLPTLLLVLVGSIADDPVRWVSAALVEHEVLWAALLSATLLALGAWALLRRRARREHGRPDGQEATEDQRHCDEPDGSVMLLSTDDARARDR